MVDVCIFIHGNDSKTISGFIYVIQPYSATDLSSSFTPRLQLEAESHAVAPIVLSSQLTFSFPNYCLIASRLCQRLF